MYTHLQMHKKPSQGSRCLSPFTTWTWPQLHLWLCNTGFRQKINFFLTIIDVISKLQIYIFFECLFYLAFLIKNPHPTFQHLLTALAWWPGHSHMSSQPYTNGEVDLYLVLESTGCYQVKPFVQIVREAGKNLHKHLPPQERGKNKIYTVFSTAELENVF